MRSIVQICDACHRIFEHCRDFAPAAPRRARTLVSVSFWGLPLPWPLLIIGFVRRYHTNYLISRSPILRRHTAIPVYHLGERTFQYPSPIWDYPQFPEVIPVLRVG